MEIYFKNLNTQSRSANSLWALGKMPFSWCWKSVVATFCRMRDNGSRFSEISGKLEKKCSYFTQPTLPIYKEVPTPQTGALCSPLQPEAVLDFKELMFSSRSLFFSLPLSLTGSSTGSHLKGTDTRWGSHDTTDSSMISLFLTVWQITIMKSQYIWLQSDFQRGSHSARLRRAQCLLQ